MSSEIQFKVAPVANCNNRHSLGNSLQKMYSVLEIEYPTGFEWDTLTEFNYGGARENVLGD